MQADSKSGDKRDAILAAALELFRLYGFRKTSVDQIAKAAGAAKPTIYAYFEHKEALFVAVCEHVLAELMARAEAAAASKGNVVSRVAAVVSAKFTTLYELVHTSPHAAELLGSQGELAKDAELRTDAAFSALLTKLLQDAAERGELDLEALDGAKSVVRLLLQAGHGASYGVSSAAEHRANVKRMVAALLRAGLPQ
ncbi:MAG: TetR/AcrR family transcriptional regulator [Myxococcales bacterium]|nr:TetR/AcrR family transcriptional regulator [Myxococcales bacterium]